MAMAGDRITVALDRRVRKAARDRCGYCLSPQHLVYARLEIEHIHPRGQGGTSDEANLWLSCPMSNKFKGNRTTGPDPVTGNVVALFNPRKQRWSDHFAWSPDGIRIVGRTPIGRATVVVLRLDSDPVAIAVRKHWVQAGWHPPTD